VAETHLLIVRITEGDPVSWEEVGQGLGIAIRTAGPGEDPLRSTGTVATVLSAGDEGQRALEWLDRHADRRESPVFAVGIDRGHRIAAQFVRRGAADYFVLPDDVEVLFNALGVAARDRRRSLKAGKSASPTDAFRSIVGDSPAIRAVQGRAERILAHRDATALLVGETGTGKEVLARAIHDGGVRRHAPFVAVNCSGIPAALFESELFGYQRGAFTDASQEKPGLFEIADGGTIFFDELGLLPLELQAKLLRVIEDRRVRRLGSTKDRRVDVRILAATNSDLEQAVRDGSFREDFYYRIGVIRLELPPLRERGDDVLLIAEVLLARLAEQHGMPAPSLTREVRHRLRAHGWPGNVRELRNALERSLLLSPPGQLALTELALGSATGAPAAPGSLPFPGTLRSITSWAARETVDRCGGNRSEAARRLDISRARLRRILGDDPHPAS
jgi:DNA-binding NtrC family response regulator